MNIIFLTIGDMSDLGESGMYPDLLKSFRDHGHQLYLLCSRERRSGLPTQRAMEYGMEVLRVRTGNITKSNLIEKGITTLLIGRQFKAAIKKYYRGIQFDLILYSTPPITLATTVSYLKERDHAYCYLMLKDIFPQNALDIGLLKRKGWKQFITNYFFAKEKNLYLLSDCIGCMSQANVEYVKSHYPYLTNKRIEVCPNTICSNHSSIQSLLSKNSLRERYQLPKDKVILVSIGNFGKPQGVDFILQILYKNIGQEKFHFVLCGSGTEYHRIKTFAKHSFNHVTVMDRIQMGEVNSLLMACDIGLIFLDHHFTIPNFPSRMLDYMKNSMPILAATDHNTDLGETILRGAFGWWCESNDVDDYQKILKVIEENPNDILDKGENSKLYLTQFFDTERAYRIIMKALMEDKST